jgi:hypothetical protein
VTKEFNGEVPQWRGRGAVIQDEHQDEHHYEHHYEH